MSGQLGEWAAWRVGSLESGQLGEWVAWRVGSLESGQWSVKEILIEMSWYGIENKQITKRVLD